jgi:hypothetical protein
MNSYGLLKFGETPGKVLGKTHKGGHWEVIEKSEG